MRTVTLVCLFVAQTLVLSSARGAELDIHGSFELETRVFSSGPAWAGQNDQALQGSVVSMTEIRWRNEEGDQRASVIPYLRWDGTDSERSLADLKEAYWAFEGDDYEVLVGNNTVP